MIINIGLYNTKYKQVAKSTHERQAVNEDKYRKIGSGVWGTPANLNGFHVLAALLHGTLGVSQTLPH